MADRSRTKFIDLNLAAGGRSDSDPETIPVLDSNNLEMMPDGSGVYNRRGSPVYNHYAPILTGANAGRRALVIESQIPNNNSGAYLAMAINTGNSFSIDGMALTKPRTNLPGDTLVTQLGFTQEFYYGVLGGNIVVTVQRSGASDKTSTVAYATSNGTASAGTDYTAASGTLTFNPYQVTQTITIATAQSSQAQNKTFFVTLSNPAGGVIVDPNPCTVILGIPACVSSWQRVTLAGVGDYIAAYIYNAVTGIATNANRVAAYYLTITDPTAGNTRQTGSGDCFMRVASDWYCHASVLSDGATTSYFTLSLWKMTSILNAGAAYSAGAGTPAAAIKVDADLKINFTGQSVDGAAFWIVPWTENKFIICGMRNSWVISMSGSGAIVNQYQNPPLSVYNAWAAFSGGRPVINSEGNLQVFVNTMDSTNVRAFVTYKPGNGELVDGSIDLLNTTFGGTGTPSFVCPVSDGGIVVHQAMNAPSGNSLIRITGDSQTATRLGSFTAIGNMCIAGDSLRVYPYVSGAAPIHLHRLTLTSSSFTDDITYTPEYNSSANWQGLVTGNSFVSRWWDGASAAANVCQYRIDTGAPVNGTMLASEVDRYNGESVSGSALGRFNNSSDNIDLFLYAQINFGGMK